MGEGDRQLHMEADGSAAGANAQNGSDEVKRFLGGIGLSRYTSKLLANGFDSLEALDAMEEEDMRQEISMLPGHVRLLQKHLTIRRGGAAKPQRAAPAAEPAGPAAAPPPDAAPAALPPADLPPPQLSAVEAAASKAPPAALPKQQAVAPGEVPPSTLQLALVPMRVERPPPESASKSVHELTELAEAEFRERRGLAGDAAGQGSGAQEAPPQRRTVEQEAEAQYIAALRAAQAAAAADPDPAGPDDTLMALAQLAEESAQMVATAASFCAWPQADVRQLAAVVESAQQGAQRAQWAAVAAVAYGETADRDKEWSQKMRRAAVQAAEVAEQYARDCAKAVTSTGRGQAIARAFCRFHAEGRCLKGTLCEFSHDVAMLQTLPLASKLELPCVFFAKGQCNRGTGCPFPHGEEELNEVIRLKRSQPLPVGLQ